MPVPCRCHNRINGRRCDTRRSLAKLPDHYTEVRYQPKCPSCGARKWYVDRYRIRKEHGTGCDCGGYWFIHRKGSEYCYHHPDAEKHHKARYSTDTGENDGLPRHF